MPESQDVKAFVHPPARAGAVPLPAPKLEAGPAGRAWFLSRWVARESRTDFQPALRARLIFNARRLATAKRRPCQLYRMLAIWRPPRHASQTGCEVRERFAPVVFE